MPPLKIDEGNTIFLNPEYVDKLIQHYGSQKIPLIFRMGTNPLLVHKVEKKQMVLPGSTTLQDFDRIYIAFDGKYYYFDLDFRGSDINKSFVSNIPVFVSHIDGKTDKIILAELEFEERKNSDDSYCQCFRNNIYTNYADNHPFVYCRDCKKERVL